MKSTFKTYFKFFIFLFGISLLTTNCQEDDIIVKQNIENNSFLSQVKQKNFAFDDLKTDAKQYQIFEYTLDKLQNTTLAKRSNKSKAVSENFEFDSNITKYTLDNYTTYTIPIKNTTGDLSSFQNIVIEADNVREASYLITYYPDETYQEFMRLGYIYDGADIDFSGNSKIEVLYYTGEVPTTTIISSSNKSSQKTSNLSQTGSGDVICQSSCVTTYTPPTDCTRGGEHTIEQINLCNPYVPGNPPSSGGDIQVYCFEYGCTSGGEGTGDGDGTLPEGSTSGGSSSTSIPTPDGWTPENICIRVDPITGDCIETEPYIPMITTPDVPDSIITSPIGLDGTSVAPTFLINALGGTSQLTNGQIGWINNNNNLDTVQTLLNYLQSNNLSSEAEAFLLEFIEISFEIPTAKFQRFEELNDILEINPWALIQDCAEQNGLDIDNYQQLYNHTLPTECTDRLDALGSDFQDQPLDEGNATVANVDYYGVEITTYPDFDGDGNPDTVAQIFEKYREDFADLASGGKDNFQFSCDVPNNSTNTGDISWEFSPYFPADATLWASSNPLTTIFKIEANADIPGLYTWLEDLSEDDGAIMISSYTPNYWIGSTITTEFSGTQPFSGNRQWGWLINQNGNLELFARAVDIARVSTLTRYNFLAGLPSAPCKEDTYYNIGEETWSNLQNEIRDWINDNGGEAEIIPKTAVRFDKEKLKEILENNETINQIIIDQINCN